MSKNIEYKCPNCGGSLVFNQEKQNVTCEYCGSEFNVDDVKKYNEELAKEVEDKIEWDVETKNYSEEELDALHVYHCDSCGGDLVTDQNTSATTCPYCGSHVILKGRLSGALKPDYVIPFKNTKESLKPTFEKYLKSKFFLPKVFKTANKIEEIKGLYEPFWIHDASVDGFVRYHATTVRRWSDANYDYKETRHYQVIRGGKIRFEHIPVDASKNIPNDLMESIEPFDFKDAKEFEPIYLSGHLADKYDINKEEVFPRANDRIRQGTIDQFRTTIHGYDTVEAEYSNISLYEKDVKYALYPIWIMTTNWEGNKYTFAMNGQTNKIVGNLPLSKGKYALTFAIIFLLTFGLTFLLAFFLMDKEISFLTFIIPIIIGLIPAGIVCHINRKALKPVKFVSGASNYYVSNSMIINESNDYYLYRNVTKTRRPNSK